MHIQFSTHKSKDKNQQHKSFTISSKSGKPVGKKKLVITTVLITLAILFGLPILAYYLDTQIPKVSLTEQYEAIDNPNSFDRDCFNNEEYSSSYEKERIVPAAKLLYERTGIQFYKFYIDVTKADVKSEDDVDDYIETWIENNVKDVDYSLIWLETNSKVLGYDDYGEIRVGYRREFIIGDKADNFFDSTGEAYFRDYWERYDCEWDTDNLYKCFDIVTDNMLNYNKHKNNEVLFTTILVLGVVAVIGFGAYILLSRKKAEQTKTILESDIDTLVDDYLERKYGDSDDEV